jgi:hypothetical protein
VILPATILALAIAAVPASAGAAVRTGSVQDPEGDAAALSGAVLDIKSLAVRYDDVAGTVRVTWTYYDDVRAVDDPNSSGGAWLDAGPLSSAPSAWVGWSRVTNLDGSSSLQAKLSLSGANGMLTGIATMGDDGHAVTAELTHPSLAGRDWQRGDGSVAMGDTVSRFWFDGYTDPNPPIYSPPLGPPGSGATPPGGGGAGGNQGMTINDGALYTNDPDVTLSIEAPKGVGSLRVSNDGGFRAAKLFPVRSTIRWHLAESGPERLPKTVYLRFGTDAQTFTDDIILDQTKPTVSAATVDAGGAVPRTAAVAQVAASSSHTYRIRVRAKDATSGVAKVQFAGRSKRHPSALWKFARISSYKGTVAPKYVRVQDRAGNFSAWRSVR